MVVTVLDVFMRLMPHGTNHSKSWDRCPIWPPDAFAAAATLAKLSGCYARIRISSDSRTLQKSGIAWRQKLSVPRRAQQAWEMLVHHGDRSLTSSAKIDRKWWRAALELVAIADEAGRGMGFATQEEARSPFSRFVFQEQLSATPQSLTSIPHSLCLDVTVSEACVQPKSRTPQVGCTVNALSHHLALLPSIGEIKTSWQQGSPQASIVKPLNLLLVPYPYRIDDDAFESRPQRGRQGRYFIVRPTWLRDFSLSAFANFLRDLMKLAQVHVADKVHGIILPEGALDLETARSLAQRLAPHGLEFLITGAASRRGNRFQNVAYTATFDRGAVFFEWWQSKRHRWKLDKFQIKKYALNFSPANHSRGWWEDIELGRQDETEPIRFTLVRPGASMAVLICEDLARIEPVQPALRAVGPNLVIVPLLDGAQRDNRWSARYAMSLADDPGAAVLTLTALGMVQRQSEAPPLVGLWRDPSCPATRELMLPWGSHALLLNVRTKDIRNWSLDSRSDLRNTVSLSLQRTWPIAHPAGPPTKR